MEMEMGAESGCGRRGGGEKGGGVLESPRRRCVVLLCTLPVQSNSPSVPKPPNPHLPSPQASPNQVHPLSYPPLTPHAFLPLPCLR